MIEPRVLDTTTEELLIDLTLAQFFHGPLEREDYQEMLAFLDLHDWWAQPVVHFVGYLDGITIRVRRPHS